MHLLDKMYVRFCDCLKRQFSHGFLAKVTEIKEKQNALLDESKIILWLHCIYIKIKDKITLYYGLSTINRLVRLLKKEIRLSGLKIVIMIMTTSILTNSTLSIITKKEIGLLGWIIRGFFVLIGFAGLFSNTVWKNINKGSNFLKFMNNISCKS